MSRSVSPFTVAILLFFAFLATFTSAAPACVERRHEHVNSTITDSTSTDTTDTTQVDDSTSNLSTNLDTTSVATKSGRATWYNTGLGACGIYDTDNEFIVALPAVDWDNGSHCNKPIEIVNPANGRSCTATIRDQCPGCSDGDLDLSPAIFQNLDGNLGDGVFYIQWYYL